MSSVALQCPPLLIRQTASEKLLFLRQPNSQRERRLPKLDQHGLSHQKAILSVTSSARPSSGRIRVTVFQ